MPYFRSTAIKRAEYDEDTRTLTLYFVETGGPYHYRNVPENIFDGLCKARSKGRYFNDHIRDKYGDR